MEYILFYGIFMFQVAGADLLKSCYLYVNPDKITNMIMEIVNKCQNHDITKGCNYTDILKVF